MSFKQCFVLGTVLTAALGSIPLTVVSPAAAQTAANFSCAEQGFSDFRYRRYGGSGAEEAVFEVPAQVTGGMNFPISLNPGNNHVIERVAFFTQGGYWNQNFPLSYTAQDIGLSVEGFATSYLDNRAFDYHAWVLENVDGSEPVEFCASAEQGGPMILQLQIVRKSNGLRSEEVFLINVN